MVLKSSTINYLTKLVDRLSEFDYLVEPITSAVETVCASYNAGGKLMLCGNGGSASDCEHIVGELMKSFVLPRKLSSEDAGKLAKFDGSLPAKLQRGIPAIALTGHASLSTAIINDTDPYMAFAQQLYVLGRPGDVLFALSTSGNSSNIVDAIKVARAFGITSAAFTGAEPSDSQNLADITINVPSSETYRVQEYHMSIYHCICLMIEEELFG